MLLALGTAAWWIVRPPERGDEGLVVYVEALDEAGRPASRAQVERVFEARMQGLDAEGRARLTHVVLRELDTPSPASIARALRVRAPFHASRRGDRPEITRREDGGWVLRVTLHAHGLLRLYVDPPAQGACKAFLEDTDRDEGWEAVEGRQIARPGAPASYRVFAGAGELRTRIEGVADRDGAVTVATRKYVFAPPPPGHVVEHVLKPDPVAPILGRLSVSGSAPGDRKPPTLRGHVRVTQLTREGGRIPLALVTVRDDGSFLARRTGKGRYELVADLDFFPGTTTVEAAGGDMVEMAPAGPARFAILVHRGVDTRQRAPTFDLESEGGGGAIRSAPFLGDNGRTFVALPAANAFRVTMRVAGTDDLPPLVGTARLPADQGDEPLALAVREAPHGTLVVETTKASWAASRGATLQCLGRRATLLRGLRETVTLHNVAAGDVPVRLQWDDDPACASEAVIDVPADGTATVTMVRPAAAGPDEAK